jgi:hypothetical protein
MMCPCIGVTVVQHFFQSINAGASHASSDVYICGDFQDFMCGVQVIAAFISVSHIFIGLCWYICLDDILLLKSLNLNFKYVYSVYEYTTAAIKSYSTRLILCLIDIHITHSLRIPCSNGFSYIKLCITIAYSKVRQI